MPSGATRLVLLICPEGGSRVNAAVGDTCISSTMTVATIAALDANSPKTKRELRLKAVR